jgi:hypothetical protein
MRKRLIFTTIMAFAASSGMIAQIPSPRCATPNTTEVTIEPLTNHMIPLVLIFVDFPDGRISGAPPTTDGELNLVANIDAVGSMGYAGTPRVKKCRKYTYFDYWDQCFSIGEYNNARHPDFTTHQGYQYDLDPSLVYDLTVYGSVRDYWREVSNGLLDFYPYPTHSTGSSKEIAGIVNNSIDVNGRKCIEWIKVNSFKSYFNTLNSSAARFALENEVINALRRAFDVGDIEFDIDSYPADGKLCVVFAGGELNNSTLGLAGAAERGGQWFQVSEKLHTFQNSSEGVVFNAITETAHEFGHTIGLYHYIGGPYDLMHWGGIGRSPELLLSTSY